MEKKGYITIPQWILELPLTLVETVIYAIIYGFSQDGETRYQGSLNYLSKMTKVSKDTVRRTLQKLVEAGYIDRFEKKVNGVTFHDYACTMQVPLANCQYPPCKLQPHNNIDNKDIDKSISIYKKEVARFVKPTVEEVRRYCDERCNDISAEAFIDYYESNGWKVGSNPMKDWKAAIRTWEKRQGSKKQTKPVQQKESYFQHNNRILAEILAGDIGGKFNG